VTTVTRRHRDPGKGAALPARRARCLWRVGAAAGLALVLSACTGDDPTATPTAPNTAPPLTAPSPSPETTETPATLSRDEAEAMAWAAVEDYLVVFDEIGADPDRDLADLDRVASGRALDWATHQITTWRDAGWTVVGAQVATMLDVTMVDLDPSGSDADYPVVALTACLDFSDADLVDANGGSVVSADRPDRVLSDFTVANVGWPDGRRWRVVRDDAQLTDSDPPEFVPCP